MQVFDADEHVEGFKDLFKSAPAPMRLMALLTFTVPELQVHAPAGTFTVSPADAELIAVLMLATEHDAALIVAA